MMTFLEQEPLPLTAKEPPDLSGSMLIEYRVAKLELRDYFAAQAIPQLIKAGYTDRSAAEMAFEIADTMLRIREQLHPPALPLKEGSWEQKSSQ